MENLTRALEIGVRETLADGLMLIPTAADKTNLTGPAPRRPPPAPRPARPVRNCWPSSASRDRPAPLASPLLVHPRLAPDGPISGRPR